MNELIKIISQTNDLMMITVEICKYFNNSCLVVNSNYQVISYATTDNFNDEVFYSAIKRHEMTYEFVSKFEEEKKDYSYLEIDKSPYKRRITCLLCEGLIVGYLIIVDENNNLLNNFSLEEFQIVEGLLAKQIVFSQHNGNIFSNKIDQFLLSLLNDNFQDERLLNLKIEYLFRKREYPDRLAIIDLHNYHNLDFLDDSSRQDIKKEIPNSYTMIYKNNILVFYSDRYKNVLYRLAEKYNLNIICSNKINKLEHIKEIYLCSYEALQLAKKIHRDYFVDDANKYSLLITFSKLASSNQIIDEKILAINEYDLKNNTEYLSLLYLYLKNQKSLQKTCSDMFIHRNTVLYRLGKMKDLFDLDIDDNNKELLYLLMSGTILYKLNKLDIFLI